MTQRHIRLAKELGKSRTKKEAMLKVGYAPSTAHQQSQILQRKGFKELLEKYGPDLTDAFDTTKRLMKATKIISSYTEPDREWPDWNAQAKGAEQTYKIHGVYNDEAAQVQGDLIINYAITSTTSVPASGSDTEQSSQVQDLKLAPEGEKNDLRHDQTDL